MTSRKLPSRSSAAILPAETKRYEIWIEGQVLAGNSFPANCIGVFTSYDFASACQTAIDLNYSPRTVATYFDPTALTMWGARLHDNETDARKRNG